MGDFTLVIEGAKTPITSNKSFEVDVNTATDLDVTKGDFFGTTPTNLSIELGSSNGSAVVKGNLVTYAPNNNYTGLDELYYSLTDSNNNKSTSKITITI